MPKLPLLALLSICFWVALAPELARSSPEDALSRECEQVFTDPAWLANEPVRVVEYTWRLNPTIIRRKQAVLGPRQLPYYILDRRPDAGWWTYYTYEGNTLGDPRWFIIYAGSEASGFFGFQMLSTYSLRIPSVEALNQAIQDFNQGLPTSWQIPVRFLSTPNAQFEAKAYLSEFADNGIVPMGNDGFYLIHDISFHISAVVLPVGIFEVLRAQIRAYVESVRFLNGFHPELLKRNREFFARIDAELASDLDQVANISARLIEPASRKDDGSVQWEDLQTIAPFGQTPGSAPQATARELFVALLLEKTHGRRLFERRHRRVRFQPPLDLRALSGRSHDPRDLSEGYRKAP